MNALKKIRRLETAAKLAPVVMLGVALLAGQALATTPQPNEICIGDYFCYKYCFRVGIIKICI